MCIIMTITITMNSEEEFLCASALTLCSLILTILKCKTMDKRSGRNGSGTVTRNRKLEGAYYTTVNRLLVDMSEGWNST